MALTNLLGVSIRDETLHLFVSLHVGCHTDAQRDVMRHPPASCRCPTEVVRCRTNTQSQRWLGTDSTATIRGLECSRRLDVRTPTESNGTRRRDRPDAHLPCTCARVGSGHMVFFHKHSPHFRHLYESHYI